MKEVFDDLAFLPKVPDGTKYNKVILPWTFKVLLANKHVSHEQIGRIMRCLFLETDLYNGIDIAGDVLHYRKAIEQSAKDRERMRALRRARKAVAESVNGNGEAVPKNNSEKNNSGIFGVKNDHVCGQAVHDTLFEEKTPPNLKEKDTPLYPPRKENPFPPRNEQLGGGEEGAQVKRKRGRPRKYPPVDPFKAILAVQGELFAQGTALASPKSTEMGQEGTSDASAQSGLGKTPQDIEPAPVPPEAYTFLRTDRRPDAAWIPGKFSEFWHRYPKKVAKKDAMKAFTRIIKSQKDVEKFMNTTIASLEWWKKNKSWTKDDGKYIPYPATWLNGGHWEDINDNMDSPEAEKYLINAVTDEELIKRMLAGG